MRVSLIPLNTPPSQVHVMGGLLPSSAPLRRCGASPNPSNSPPTHLSYPRLTPSDHLSHPGTAAQGDPEVAAAAAEGGSVPGSTGDVRVVRAEVAQASGALRSRISIARHS